MIYAIRGATTIENITQESEEMVEAVGTLLSTILEKNALDIANIISIQFSQTPDLKKKNAASALRQADIRYSATPLFCTQEPEIQNMMPRVVRVLLSCRGEGPGIPVYLGRAGQLRSDFIG